MYRKRGNFLHYLMFVHEKRSILFIRYLVYFSIVASFVVGNEKDLTGECIFVLSGNIDS